MLYHHFIDEIRKYELKYDLEEYEASWSYQNTLYHLRIVQQNLRLLNNNHLQNIVRPFLLYWGKMGRVLRKASDSDWDKLKKNWIYITHCSAKKDDKLKNSRMKVTPDKLYVAIPIKRFMNKCKTNQVKWAIFSDLYGIWFPFEKHEWYDKHPNSVTEKEFRKLVKNFEEKLINFNKICFYYNPGRFHPLYQRLINEVKIKEKIHLFSHLLEIVQ